MPGATVPETCPACAGRLKEPPLERCTEPWHHDPPPGKGQNPPYMKAVAEAVADSPTEDDEQNEPGKDLAP